MFPCDIVVLGSEIESGIILFPIILFWGACYIETSSLDGEKNLKPKSAMKETQEVFNKIDKAYDSQNADYMVEAKGPVQGLYEFDGSITLK